MQGSNKGTNPFGIFVNNSQDDETPFPHDMTPTDRSLL